MRMNDKNKKDATLVEIGDALFRELGFYAASNSIKPLYVANGLFREVTGTICEIEDIYDWVRGENSKKSISSKDLLEKYTDIIMCYQNEDDSVDELKEIRYYLEKLFNPDSNIQAGAAFSVPNISSIWQVTSSVPAEQGIGGFLFKILNTEIEGKKSKAIDVIERSLKDDDDDITRTIKPIIVSKSEKERKVTRDLSTEVVDYTIALDTIRRGFDCLAENCSLKPKATKAESLLTLRRTVNYAMFSIFYYLSDINHSKYSGQRVPLLLDAGTGTGAIINASSRSFTECKKAMEKYTVNFVREWLIQAKIISDINEKNACESYLKNDINVTDEVRAILEKHFENNSLAGDPPILATAKAIQFAMYTKTYSDTTPSEFCNVIGVKAGLVGPSGNTNYRRLLINRFLLETIVLSCVSKDKLEAGIELRELGDILRDNYNIVIGTDTDADYAFLDELEIARNTPEDLRGSLALNAKEIAEMLISLGLGKKYADGVTIIGRGL